MTETKQSRNLPCKLTDREKLDRGSQLAELNEEMATIEQQKKAAATGFKSAAEGAELRAADISRVIRSGVEFREVECHWNYQWHDGTKTLVRQDTLEIVETDIISASERQKEFEGLADGQKAN